MDLPLSTKPIGCEWSRINYKIFWSKVNGKRFETKGKDRV